MEVNLQEIVFYVVAIVVAVCSALAVSTGRILRAATYLLFVLFGTAAIYIILGYTFLGAVQLMVYAGGIVVLYVFSILLTRSDKDMKYKISKPKLVSVLLTTLVGAALILFLVFTNGFVLNSIPQAGELGVKEIGMALIGGDKYEYVLPFELLSDKTPPTVNVWVVATSKFTQFKACGEGLDIWESIVKFPSIVTFPFPLKLSLVWYQFVELRVSENRKSPRTFSVEFVPV